MSSKMKDLVRSIAKITACAMLICAACAVVSCNKNPAGDGTETKVTTSQTTEATTEGKTVETTESQSETKTENIETGEKETEPVTEPDGTQTEAQESYTSSADETEAQPSVTDKPELPVNTEGDTVTEAVETEAREEIDTGSNNETVVTEGDDTERREPDETLVTDAPSLNETETEDVNYNDKDETEESGTSAAEGDASESTEAKTETSFEETEDRNETEDEKETEVVTTPMPEPDDDTEQTDANASEQTTEENVPEETTEQVVIPEPEMPGLEFELNEDGESYGVKGMGEIVGEFVVIPATHKGKPVTAIMDEAFRNSGIVTVKFGTSITKIGAKVFDGCGNMTIYYGGTKKQWIAIQKDKDWAEGIGKYSIYPMHNSNNNWEIPVG